MPVFSLPGKYGIGTFGKESRDFIDYLFRAKQNVWQMLPLGRTTFGDSPYQPMADGSLNPYFTDLDDLYEKGLLTKGELRSAVCEVGEIDYGKLYRERYPLLGKAYSRFVKTEEFYRFSKKNAVKKYSAFAALKDVFSRSFDQFPKEYKYYNDRLIARVIREYGDEFYFHVFTQYILYGQFSRLKEYANGKGISLIGDLPLYAAYDGADVWSSPENFRLDEDLKPTEVAGVPPDYFSEDGQLWGNPIYNYAEMEKSGYRWWKNRLKTSLAFYDIVRIDHFRGLDRYWAIPYGSPAKEGGWKPCPGREILRGFSPDNLIAEDLGTIDDGVRSLINDMKLRGMKVLLFALDGNPQNPYLPENVPCRSVCYTGTHDNDTVAGLREKLPEEERERFDRAAKEAFRKVGVKYTKSKRGASRAFVEAAFACKAEIAIVPFADVKGLGNEYRINTPSTVGNWRVRFPKRMFDEKSAEFLAALADKYDRSRT